MKAPRTELGLRTCLIAAALAIAALPSSAAAEAYVPPGNSAATQYTEAVPTAGGPKATGKSKRRHGNSPGEVLGTRNAERLDAKGPEGKAAAEVAAATAAVATAPGSGGEPGQAEGPNAAGHGGSAGAGSGSGGAASNATADAESPARSEEPSGSSGLGEVASQVTGTSSSGGMGTLLPLLIVGAVAWSIAYLVRQRKRPAG